MQLLEVGPGIRAELIGYDLPGTRVHLQRLRRPARAVQRTHQLGPQPFPQRVLCGEPSQLSYQLGVPAARPVGLDPQLKRGKAQLFQAIGLGRHQGPDGTSAKAGPRHSASASAR